MRIAVSSFESAGIYADADPPIVLRPKLPILPRATAARPTGLVRFYSNPSLFAIEKLAVPTGEHCPSGASILLTLLLREKKGWTDHEDSSLNNKRKNEQ